MTEHWCLVGLDCLLSAMPFVQICVFDVPAASGSNKIKENKRKEEEEEEDLHAK
jgi:hypothetical protein